MRKFVLAFPAALALTVLACTSDEAGPTATPTTSPSVAASPTPAASATSAAALTSTATSAPTPEPTPLPPPVDEFTGTGQLLTPRFLHTATLLEDGRVLVVGGSSIFEALLASAELYLPGSPSEAPPDDPQYPALLTGAFASTGSLNEARQTHAATRLADGRVLVTGGVGESGIEGRLASAEIYDPTTALFEPVGEMTTPRIAHSSTLLADGRALIVGGFDDTALATAELFDPETGQFTATGSMQQGGAEFPSLVNLADGRVLVHGAGFGDRPPPEIYDPATGRFTTVTVPDLPTGFRWPTNAVGLDDGSVLLTGDCCAEDGVTNLGTAVILDPVANTIEVVASMNEGRAGHQAVLLNDGRVLITGGLSMSLEDGVLLASVELFDPRRGAFTSVGPMSDVRRWPTVTRLLDGQVLVVGVPGEPHVRSAELFRPRSPFAP